MVFEYEECPHTESLHNLEFLVMHGITPDSHPAKRCNVFVPRNRKRQGSEGFTSIVDTTLFTNKNSYLFNAGVCGTQYPNFTPFSVDIIMRHIGMYMLNCLYPSPQVEMKYDSQERNPTNVSDICNQLFDTGTKRRHKEFNTFLAIQELVKPVP